MANIRKIVIAVILVLSAAMPAFAGITVIDAEQVKTILKGKKPHALIDSRLPDEYLQSHIPGAINIPAERMAAESARLPKGKNTPLIFYCRGVG